MGLRPPYFMAKTVAEIKQRALQKLGKLAFGATAESALDDDIQNAYDQVYDRLEGDGLVAWSKTGSVPDKFVQQVVAIVAFERSDSLPADKYNRLAMEASMAPTKIAKHLKGPWVNPLKPENF